MIWLKVSWVTKSTFFQRGNADGHQVHGTSLVAQVIKNPLEMWETWVRPLDWEDPLQSSGLENSIDCIVHWISNSQTWLSDFHFHFQQSLEKIFNIINHQGNANQTHNELSSHICQKVTNFPIILLSKFSYYQKDSK